VAVSFDSPSFRAASSDLTVAISPLGLVELADEEFEVHGPRLNRYASNWAFYLGHHWGYRREQGEPQLTFNYVRAFSDFLTNFTFSRGVQFITPKETEHIVPALLKSVWEVDNQKDQVLWELGNQGGVSGDTFVKVAWEPPDPESGQPLPRVRILVLNSAYCFPEWHPHDRGKLLRFKLKYKFWGTSPEGTRTVFTYTEILTNQVVEEYINDELIDQRPNPLGVIPIVHIPNVPVSGSPWGLADIQDILSLNREYNEKATDISDIVAYHAAPVTIITGAKASNLEKSARKVWGGLPKEANVYNLENGVDLVGPLEYLHLLKLAMHEMMGIPEVALGQIQPISNTSGVALAIQYQPTMSKYHLKRIQYTAGLKKINEFVLRTLAFYDPDRFIYDPLTEGIIEDGQPEVLNLADPLTYQTDCHWPPPLPLDAMVKLQEITQKMMLGIESKRSALRELGEQFPDEKVQELFDEQVREAKEQGALEMLKAQINSAMLTVMSSTLLLVHPR
jgi:hypothetical protein